MTDNPYLVGTTVFAKLKGYPWWPARIENEGDLPDNVSSKKPRQRPIWPVFFYGSYDYGWFGASELKSFDPASAERAKTSLRKGNALRTALGEALDPSLIPKSITSGVQDEDEEEEEEEEEEQETAPARKKAAAKTKKSSNAEPAAKKRRASASEDQGTKRKTTKRALPAEDENEDETPKPRKRAGAASRSHQESEKRSLDEDISGVDTNNGRTRKSEEDAGDSSEHNRAKKKLRSGQPNERLLKLRHKLQKLLLVEGLSDEVLVQNLERADPILAEVEAFEIDLQMLKDTKIGRLMKKISVLQFSRDPHRIVERSVALIKQYKSMMEKAQGSAGTASPTDKKPESVAPVTSSITGNKPIGVEGVVSGGVTPHAPIVSSHILDVPPVPEAVVAAVAAIVETNTLISSETSNVNDSPTVTNSV
ncbi:hypothetical protein BG011_006066 [Mortierella polycephala]|uniref:PWWP domain-containing protein n=1 Tax=Mortierella polycephala TaxID=41804 RepID=A0A9P6QBB2_9FUNG|nr:hypothetical protein BG011_006066 [Mortierella polycephala]